MAKSTGRSSSAQHGVARSVLRICLALSIIIAVAVHISECGVEHSRRLMLLRSRCGRQLQEIAEACFLYQDEYGGLPGSLGDLTSAGYTDPEAREFLFTGARPSEVPAEGAVFTVPGIGSEVVVREEDGRFEVVGSPFTIVACSPVTRASGDPLLEARVKGWRAVLYANNDFEWHAVEEGPGRGR